MAAKPHERLTPRGIALAHLVNLFATHRELPLAARHELALTLIEQLSGSGGADSVIEQGLVQLRAALASLPRAFLDTFDALLVATTTPDDLWTLMGSLHELISPETARTSPVDPDAEDGCARRPPQSVRARGRPRSRRLAGARCSSSAHRCSGSLPAAHILPSTARPSRSCAR